MSIEAFSEAWAQEWCRVLSGRPGYREAAADWEGSVCLIMTRDSSATSERRAVFVDLWHGECREARAATETDQEQARFVLAARASTWRDVLNGRLAPLMAMMSGKLRLTRGSMANLIPFAGAARELMLAATEMETIFPYDWT